MKVILLDNKEVMCREWKKYFKDISDVVIVNEYLESFDLKDVDCLVSPANSYGLMDGGYDFALTRIFGKELSKSIQDYIIHNLYGEQPVASAIIVDIPNTNKKLIHTPTMRVPSPIKDPEIIYTAMRATLICALKNNINTIIIPAFGGSTGMVPFPIIAKEMYKAYIQIFGKRIEVHSWIDVDKRDHLIEEILNK